jgi:hypothetical protein
VGVVSGGEGLLSCSNLQVGAVDCGWVGGGGWVGVGGWGWVAGTRG